MALRPRVVGALRYLKTHQNVSGHDIDYMAGELLEEGEPAEVRKYLRSAYQYLKKNQFYKPTHPLMRNIARLSRQVSR